jgi:hypothetical protein
MYRYKKAKQSLVKRSETTEGETIENKVERMVHNKEPIKDGAIPQYSERKDGVMAGWNIRTDKWEVATDAVGAINKSREAKSQAKMHIVKNEEAEEKDGGAESAQG